MPSSLLITPDAMVAPGSDQWPPRSPDGELTPLAIQTKYELDPFQKHAVLGIHAGDHVFVTAKTGSGKTFVGEYLIAYWLARGKRVFYTTPIKSLSNQKYHDLKKLFPEATVGILTGDIKMCPDAQIVVLTAEILRNLFYKRGTATEKVGLTSAVSLEGVAGVVMDEVHYIQDPDRGHVWEESLILCAPSKVVSCDTVVPSVVVPTFQLVLLSATLPSAGSLAGWLADLHKRRTLLLSTTYRIVPLVHGILEKPEGSESWKVRPILDTKGGWIPDGYMGWLKGRKAIADAALAHKKAVEARRIGGYSSAPPTNKVRIEDPIQRLRRTIQWLENTKQLPALFFVFSRKECERYAGLVEGSLIDSSDAAAARHILEFHLSRYRDILEKSPQYHRIRDLLLRGIAFHHSGLQPLLKEIVEILFTRGYVKVLFATETFSVGLNMPTKTVVFLELEKWSDGCTGNGTVNRRALRADEYIQMAGRAGRRGLDTQGLVLYEPLREPVETSVLKTMLTGSLPALQSRMRFHYDFLLKQRLTGDSGVAEQSYWALQQKATRVSLGKELALLEDRYKTQEAMLTPEQRAALEERVALEQDVAQSVNAKRKKAQLALNRWITEHDYKNMEQLMTTYTELCGLQKELSQLQAEITAWDAAPLLNLGPQESCLRTWGFLNDDGSLTQLGLTATEVNEGHAILMPLLAASGELDSADAEEIACTLAAFLQEGRSSDEPMDDPTDTFAWIKGQANQCEREEDSVRAYSPSGFWSLSPLWVAVTKAWLAGDGLSQIATAFGLFEGNIQRALLRIASLLEEWGAIATLRTDLATLEKLNGLRFLRDEVIVDSLYLRL
jgi:superfamily II RNA helicase